MESSAKRQPLPQFLGVRHLRQWLVGSPVGRQILHECESAVFAEWLFGSDVGKAYQEEIVDRFISGLRVFDPDQLPVAVLPQPTPIVVEVFHDGYIRVHGAKHCKVAIIERPQEPTVKHEVAVEQWVEASLHRRHRDVYGRVVASGYLLRLAFSEWLAREQMREIETKVVESL